MKPSICPGCGEKGHTLSNYGDELTVPCPECVCTYCGGSGNVDRLGDKRELVDCPVCKGKGYKESSERER